MESRVKQKMSEQTHVNDEQTNEMNNKTKIKPDHHEPAKSLFFTLMKLIVASILGFVFGLAMEKSKVYEPTSIKKQMIFQKFIMLKMFFAALATSTLSILLLSFMFRKRYNEVFVSYQKSLTNKSILIIVLGGSLLGLGIEISGACPGMVLVQLGAGVPWSFITFIGGLCGALVHGLCNSYIMRDVKGDLVLSKTLYEILSNINPTITRSLVILLLSVSVGLMEIYIPWTSEYKSGNSSSNIFTDEAWPPSVCGILIGILQFFSILFLSKSLGTSSSYTTIVGIPFASKDKFEYFYKFRSGLSNWLTVIFVSFAILGGFISSKVSGVYALSQGIHPYSAFLGGFLMVFGARIAGGCTSGHGISGVSHQFIGSFIAVISMFSSAILIGFYNNLS
jgi:uncharacterized membrane protein YedE/YeeE